ncbi:SMI1/KNR4 family protein [Photorhabdus laumondii]|uniref:SMI1/KNR4 family protein n=1 Tax=Photorhabdus laumondii TaxID=2218628 RepID=UPI0025B06776|nr:SMI1/KNR4 family protein [Photorhabdus laumondii]
MNTKLNDVIEEIERLSDGQRNDVDLPDDELISQYEKEIGFEFSNDYKEVLKKISNIFYGTIDLLSVTRDKKYYGELSQALNDAREQGLPENLLPICEDNGSYYCIDYDGKIKYWTLDGYNEESWPDLASWIKQVWIEGN